MSNNECTIRCLNTCYHYDSEQQLGMMCIPGADNISFYIPRIHKNFDESQVRLIFENRKVGKVRRIDFVPLTPVAPGQRESEYSVACCYQKAFVHFDHLFDSEHAHDIFRTVVRDDESYRIFASTAADEYEYWILLNNKMAVPDTTLNDHQIAENHRILAQTVMEQAVQIEKLNELVHFQDSKIAVQTAQIVTQTAQIERLLELVMKINMQMSGSN